LGGILDGWSYWLESCRCFDEIDESGWEQCEDVMLRCR
jgi:hypothetical protein